LVDETLILAILADYSPDSFYASLPNVQEDLGMLQASAVPDPDQEDDSSHHPAPSSSSQGVDPASNAATGLGLTANHHQRPFSGSSRTSSSMSSSHSRQDPIEPTPQVVARDFAATAPVKRYKTKRARPSYTILQRPTSQRKSSSFGTKAQRYSSVDDEASLSESSQISVSPEAKILGTSDSNDQATEANTDGISPSDIPHLAEAAPRTLVEVAPGAPLVEVHPYESDTQDSETETGLTTDETDDDLIPESKFDPLVFLKEIFGSM
jgi:hypothetical protein